LWRNSQHIPSCTSHDHVSRRHAFELTADYLFSEKRGRSLVHYYTAYWLTKSHRPAVIFFNSAPRKIAKMSSDGFMVMQLVADSKRRT
jgi:hypothetical protein